MESRHRMGGVFGAGVRCRRRGADERLATECGTGGSKVLPGDALANDWPVPWRASARSDGSARGAGGVLLRIGGRRGVEDERCGADVEPDFRFAAGGLDWRDRGGSVEPGS